MHGGIDICIVGKSIGAEGVLIGGNGALSYRIVGGSGVGITRWRHNGVSLTGGSKDTSYLTFLPYLTQAFI